MGLFVLGKETLMDKLSRLRVPSVRALALYLATVVAEVPVIFARMLLTLGCAALLLFINGESAGQAEELAEFALIPTGWAVLALATPLGGGWWWMQKMGGREPSDREQIAYADALQLLQSSNAQPTRLPVRWFVIDSVQPDAAVCGDTLMLSRGLLESDYLPAVLAHELGHLATSDGKLTAALNRLIVRPFAGAREERPRERTRFAVTSDQMLLTVTFLGALLWLVRALFRFVQGGLGLQLLGAAWGSYWREREYLADRHAAQLGQAEELADFLEIHALIHDHPVPFIWLSEHTHPPSELRIDRLRKAGQQAVAVAPGSEPVKAAPTGPPAAGPDGPALTEPAPSAVDLSSRQG